MHVTVSVNLSTTKHGQYSYGVSAEQFKVLTIGSQVVVNVNNQLKLGTVIKISEKSNFDFNLKPIITIYKAKPLNTYQAKIAKNIYLNSVANYLDIQTLFVPVIADGKIDVEYYENGNFVGTFKQNKELRNKQLESKCVLKYKDHFKTYSYVKLSGASPERFTDKQQIVVDYVGERELVSISKVISETGISRGVVETLIKHNVLEKVQQAKQFETLFDLEWHQNNQLSAAQRFAYDSLKPGQNLLYGVSSSGKTEIYIELIKQNLQRNQQTLIIVPSVMLAVQVVGRMQKLFSEQVIIYHNNLTEAEKASYTNQIRTNQKKIVISTFDGLFLPFNNLSYVIFDEAHSNNYKVGKKINVNKQIIIDSLIEQHIDVLLGTATPLISDYAMTQYGKVNLVVLTERFGISEFPEIRYISNDDNVISEDLKNLVKINKTRSKPTIVFFNKSGYSRQVLCKACYHLHLCPTCNKPLSYSMRKRRLECKYDGYSKSFNGSCQRCQSTNIKYIGIGIEQYYNHLKAEFPELSMAVVDGTMKAQQLYEVMHQFGQGEIDVLVGTQTIAFGIDFLNVDNIYVVNIDNLLTLNEVSSHEKVYNLLEQVVGRVGRNSKFSNAIVETDFANHYVMEAVKQHSYYNYYNAELKLRKTSNNPPYYRICKVELLAENERKLVNVATQFISILTTAGYSASNLQTPYIAIRYNKHRRYFIVKYKHQEIRKIIKQNIGILDSNNIDYNIDLNNNEIGV